MRRIARRSFLTRTAAGACLGLSVAPLRAAVGGLPSAVGHTDSSPEWEALRSKLFGRENIVAAHLSAQPMVQLIVPLRAAYGASVPVKIVSQQPQTPERHVRRMTLLVDKNPSPVAAQLQITPAMGQANLETRLRVDEYSHIRVITEWSSGELHMDSRYVKVSGGCSAPPNRDQLNLIGKTVFRLPEGVKPNALTSADVTVVHPNDTGFELNNVTVMFIPPHFVRALKVSYGGQQLFDAELDFSISENPSFRFNFLAQAPGELLAEVEDSKDGRFQGRLPVAWS
jgi:sulfur-oxidizing protein SoxY